VPIEADGPGEAGHERADDPGQQETEAEEQHHGQQAGDDRAEPISDLEQGGPHAASRAVGH
jgi:hypothetical protein